MWKRISMQRGGSSLAQMGELVRQWEAPFDPVIAAHLPILVRLDGVAFRTLTRHVRKPFDPRLSQSMIRTAEDLVAKFGASIAYTISDEISLLLPPVMVPSRQQELFSKTSSPSSATTKATDDNTEQDEVGVGLHRLMYEPLLTTTSEKRRKVPAERTHLYNGRSAKLVSVLASYATARFHQHYAALVPSHANTDSPAIFDARVCPIQDPRNLVRFVLWRQKYDGYRNQINHIGHYLLGHKRLQGLKRSQVEQLLLEELHFNVRQHLQPQEPQVHSTAEVHLWSSTKEVYTAAQGLEAAKTTYPSRGTVDDSFLQVITPAHVYGTFIKKDRVLAHVQLPPDVLQRRAASLPGNQEVEVERTRIRSESFDWNFQSEEEAVRFLFAKFWNSPTNTDSADSPAVSAGPGIGKIDGDG